MTDRPKSSCSSSILKQWQTQGLFAQLLRPIAWIYSSIQQIRRLFYQYCVHTYRAPCPVIVIGNIYLGGTGKTPLTLLLIKELQKLGLHPGVISRGYGIKIGPHPRLAWGQALPQLVGDEPAILAKYAPVCVHPKRSLAAKCLLSHFPQTNIILSDDGLQHWGLERDIEIIVQDSRGQGNGFVLPAGPLREHPKRYQEVDFIIDNLTGLQNAHHTPPVNYSFVLLPTTVRQICTGKELTLQEWQSQYANLPCCAIAGIGNPQRFFNTLNEQNFSISQTITFPDHHHYCLKDFATIKTPIIIMTEKDGIKCQDFNDERLWSLQVEAKLQNPEFLTQLLAKIKALPLYSLYQDTR